jgi:hypothetical protein
MLTAMKLEHCDHSNSIVSETIHLFIKRFPDLNSAAHAIHFNATLAGAHRSKGGPTETWPKRAHRRADFSRNDLEITAR